MASLVIFLGIVAAVTGILAGAFIMIGLTIGREDRTGSISGEAPSRACRNARFMTGYHRLRWDDAERRGGIANT